MIDGSFKGFNPPPNSSPFGQEEFDFGSNKTRTPVTLESFQLPAQFIDIKRACDEYNKKSFLGKLFSTRSVVSKIIEFNNLLNDRVLTLNRNVNRVHSSIEDLATDLELLQKEIGESKSTKQNFSGAGIDSLDRISSLEAEQRQLKSQMSQLDLSTAPNMILWAIGITLLNVLIAYGIFNGLAL